MLHEYGPLCFLIQLPCVVTQVHSKQSLLGHPSSNHYIHVRSHFSFTDSQHVEHMVGFRGWMGWKRWGHSSQVQTGLASSAGSRFSNGKQLQMRISCPPSQTCSQRKHTLVIHWRLCYLQGLHIVDFALEHAKLYSTVPNNGTLTGNGKNPLQWLDVQESLHRY